MISLPYLGLFLFIILGRELYLILMSAIYEWRSFKKYHLLSPITLFRTENDIFNTGADKFRIVLVIVFIMKPFSKPELFGQFTH